MIKNQNVELVAGDTPIIAVAIAVSDGSNFDPTGATGIWTLSKAAASTGADVYAAKSTASGGAAFVQDATTLLWSLQATLAETDTSGLAAGAYYHEALVIEASGQRSHLMTGKFTILATPNP